MLKTIHCTVTNDLNQDQRMHRICTTFVELGYNVTLIGRLKKNSQALLEQPFNQKRIVCFFQKGPFFYVEFNLKLWIYLIWHKQDIIYSVDTDTLFPTVCIKWLKGKKLIFDAHEYFTEVPELSERNFVKSIWSWVEKFCIPKVDLAITVNQSLADIFTNKWKITFHTIYNVPIPTQRIQQPSPTQPFILYQGVLNKGRGLEALIEAMALMPKVNLVIAGEGDLSLLLIEKAKSTSNSSRIKFIGWQSPDDLRKLTAKAALGINLLEGNSKNYFFSLANKFFDYMHAGVPSVNMNFPEYANILKKYDIGYLLDDLDPTKIANLINHIMADEPTLEYKRKQCIDASEHFNWKIEAMKLKLLVLQI